MKIVSTIALGLALALAQGATPAFAKDKPAQGGGQKFSEKIIPILQEIQKAQAAKDWPTVKAKADSALPLVQTPDDKLFVGQAYVMVGQNANDNASLSKGVDMMLDSGKTDAATAAKLQSVQGQLAYIAKDYQKAEPALTGAYNGGSTDPNTVPMLVEAKRNLGKNREAVEFLNAAIAKQTAAGQQVPVEWYQRGFTMAYQAKPGTPDYEMIHQAGSQLNLKWLAAAPTPQAWHDVLLYVTQNKSGDPDFMLDAHRLAMQSGGLIGAGEYLEYADSLYQKNPGEAKMVIDAGLKKNAFTLASNRSLNEINGIATQRIPADKASLAGSEKAAQGNPKVALSLGDAYYAYGNYAKAIAMYKLAGSKGADADLVNVRVGTVLAVSGDAAGAKEAFGMVKGGPRKELADLWLVHIDHPTAG